MRYLKFSDGFFSGPFRSWCPITGKAHKYREPRVVKNFILEVTKEPVIYHRFEADQGFTAYNSDPGCYHRDGETTDYLSDWMTTLEECNPNVERLLLGQSYEGRDIEAFRLGPKDRQHFAFTCVVHGNESDALVGTLKAFEILFTHPDFARLRDEYTLFIIPCCNPDGFYAGTRDTRKLGPHPSGVDQYINLNRVWPWFWDEFVPTANESKGAVPMDCPEAQAMYLWRTEGNDGQPTPVRFLLDQHSTAGDGARYQSRDRNFKSISEYDWFTVWADYMIYRYVKATQTKRVWEDDMPDLFINYFRSRYVPHWHTWNSNILPEDNGGICPISMVDEYNKVAYVTVDIDPETYQSACNYALDYALCSAQVMQSGLYEARDGMLIESAPYILPTVAEAPPYTYGPQYYFNSFNHFNNPSFTTWNERSAELEPAEYRPSYWSNSRSQIIQSSHEDRHVEYQGRPMTVRPQLKVAVPEGSNIGPSDNFDVYVDTVNDITAIIIGSINESGGFVFSYWAVNISLYENSRDTVSDNTQQLRFLWFAAHQTDAGVQEGRGIYVLLGTASIGMTLQEYYFGVLNVLFTYASARMNAATALDDVDAALYILGGETSAGVYTRTVISAHIGSPNNGFVEIGTNLLNTPDSGGEAVFCVNGSLDGLIVMVGGKATDSYRLRVVVVDVSGTPSSVEYLVDVTGTTLPYKLISCGLVYDGVDTLWIYGGENPDTGEVYNGVWTLTWDSPDWIIEEHALLAESGEDVDSEDYGGSSPWVRRWSRWRAARMYNDVDNTYFTFLAGGVEQDAETGLLLPGPYRESFIHTYVDNTLTRPENQNYAYARANVHYDIVGYTLAATSWSLKAEPNTTTGYVRINNSPGSDVDGILTTRRTRTYYMHPPRTWWWREHASIDLTAGDPLDNEDQLRCYVRVYQDNESIAFDAPMLTCGTMWPYSWVPAGVGRSREDIEWRSPEFAFDRRWFRLSFTFLPQAGYLCLDDQSHNIGIYPYSLGLVLLSISTEIYPDELQPSTLLVVLDWGTDPKARTYVRNQVHGDVTPVIRLLRYDPIRDWETCTIDLCWGGYYKDTARGRFDTPITFEVWQHAEYGCGIIVNNYGAIGKAFISGRLDKEYWSEPGYLSISAGGWWAEPKVYEITDEWVLNTAMVQEPTRALVLGERDPTWGQVSANSTFKYTEDFHRADGYYSSSWTLYGLEGLGWQVYSNQFRCGGHYCKARWSAYPYLRDVSIIGEFRTDTVDSRVGLLSRMLGSSSGRCYAGILNISPEGAATIEIWYMGYTETIPVVPVRTVLGSASCAYTLTEVIELEFETVGSTLTLTARSGETVLATTTAVDTTWDRPGYFALFCETSDYTNYVYCLSVRSEPRGINKIRLTD